MIKFIIMLTLMTICIYIVGLIIGMIFDYHYKRKFKEEDKHNAKK